MARYIDADNINLKGIAVFDQDLEALIPLSNVRRALQMTPTADVREINHGRWISNKLGTCKLAYYCSECGWIDGYPFNNRHKYCPNCGAKMDGEE
nr:MAG TPA: DNA-directed RNA polymerase [Caudoviricetes sp.]